MANVKITELTALTDPASTDVLPIVDVVADVTKKISIADLLENAGSGTAAAPGIAFDGDSNAGIYRPGADQVAFATNGTGRLFIDATGNVGIGASSPGATLKVQPVSSDIPQSAFGIRQNNAADTIQTTLDVEIDPVNSTARILSNATSSPRIGLYTSNQLALYIDESQLVGIGTSSPEARLHSRADGDEIKALLYLQNRNGGANAGSQISFSNSTTDLTDTRLAYIRSLTSGAGQNGNNLTFGTNLNGGAPTEHFRIAGNGDLTATDTTIGSNSDSRLKTNIADFAYDLEVFKQYQPKTFDWKNPNLHGNKTSQRGFIAQDVEAIDDYWVGQQAVGEDSADAEFLDADRLAKTLKLGKKDAMYVSVIQQLLAKVETLETKVAALEAS